MPRHVSRPRYTLLRAAPAGRPQRAGGAASAGAWRGRWRWHAGAPGGGLPERRRKNATRRLFWGDPCRTLLPHFLALRERLAQALPPLPQPGSRLYRDAFFNLTGSVWWSSLRCVAQLHQLRRVIVASVNRSRRKSLCGCASLSRARDTRCSPIAGANLKPCPENPAPTTT